MERCLRERSHSLVERGGAYTAVSGPVTMSKSAGNGVAMGPFVREHGSDVARVTLLFAAPPENNMEWSDEGVGGAERFLGRLSTLFAPDRNALANSFARLGRDGLEALLQEGDAPTESERALWRRVHATVQKVTQDTEQFAFNTAIAALMELLNDLQRHRQAVDGASDLYCAEAWATCRLLGPFAPHLAEELHSWFGASGSVFDAGWPRFRADALVEETVEIVLQVNGRVRDRVAVPREADEETLRSRALASQRVQEAIGAGTVRKVIIVPGRLVNVVA
jgi:leucyl-tRNA synthetase